MTRAKDVIEVMKDESYRKVKTKAAPSFDKWAYSPTGPKLNLPAFAKTMSYFDFTTFPSKMSILKKKGIKV